MTDSVIVKIKSPSYGTFLSKLYCRTHPYINIFFLKIYILINNSFKFGISISITVLYVTISIGDNGVGVTTIQFIYTILKGDSRPIRSVHNNIYPIRLLQPFIGIDHHTSKSSVTWTLPVRQFVDVNT